MSHDRTTLFAAIEATWPAADTRSLGPWTLRDGRGGGKRVSAATAAAEMSDVDIPIAEEAMRAMGQDPLFMIRADQAGLDAMLEARGYRIVDPVNLYYGTIQQMATVPPPRALVFSIWPPLEIQKDIWKNGGIGPARVDVMHRAQGTKTAILGRHEQSPAGTAFAAVFEDIVMVHAVEVAPDFRRLGVARMMTTHSARWAHAAGATHMAVLCTQENAAANALYASLGLEVVGQYHYRML